MSPRPARRLRSAVAAWLCLAGAAAGADPTAPAVLHLTDGGRLPGAPRGSADPAVWRWESPAFTRPLDFPVGVVAGVHYAVPPVPPRPPGEYCVELTGGDVVYGDLAAVTDDEVGLSGTPVGRLRLRREDVRRIYRWKGNDTVYFGPNGLTGWADPAKVPQWREEGGDVLTDQPRATLFADVGVPDRALIEIGLSWKAKADFLLALGVDDSDEAVRRGFRLEVLDGQLVVVGESARDADLAVVQPAGPGGGQARLRVYLDQPGRRLTLMSGGGKPLATLAITGKLPPPRRGVRLVNGKGDVRVEHLRVARWDGPPPRDFRDGEPRLFRTDGSVVYGRLAGYDPQTGRFTIRDGGRETVIPREAVADVYPVPPRDAETGPPATPRALRVVLRDGTRVSGTPDRVEDTHLTLTCPGIKDTLRIPLAAARALIPLRPGEGPARPAVAGRPGRLEMDGLSLTGRLVGGGEPAAGGLVWHPDVSRNPSPLRPGFSGRIVYRDPPAQGPSAATPQPPPPAQPGFFARILGTESPPPAPQSPPATGRRALHLRTGDVIPCEVTRIDERGVTFKSPQAAVTFVPHEKVKSVELVPTRDAPDLDETKRDRLLTLPRAQKGAPPTHLVCAKTGDFLRGRVVDMDDARLTVEVRLETKEVPRDRVAQIIWLHPDELAAKPAAAPAGDPRTTRAQTVAADGNRLTFVVGASDGKTISGTSDVLGACRVNLADVDQVLFGSAIERSAADLAYQRWKLHHAVEPQFVRAGAGSTDGGAAVLDSPLVGQPAPAVRLDLLDGSKFDLAEHKGRVVVLDFWATWCGPCLQSMPLVEGVAREFADRGVELVAVNMEEEPGPVKSVLDRHKLRMPVALDRDGVAAARYAVTAIPQVVVIDRDGKVARLFVGGGKETADSLRKCLQQLLAK